MTRKEQVLRYVNRLREKHGIGGPLAELPKGSAHPLECPIARSINGSATVSGICIGTCTIATPKYVREFITAFDAGRYPELER